MENGNNYQPGEEIIQEVALVKQADSTVKILQEDDLKTLKEALDKVTNFKRRYSVKKLTVTDITSKDQKEKLRLAIADLRSTRTSLEKDKKAKTAPYRDTVSYINENYDKAIDAISKIEDPLKDYKKEIDEKVEELEKQEELKQAALLNERVDKLMKAGIVFHPDSKYYVIGSEEFEVPVTSFDAADIQSMTDKIFEGQLAIVTEKSETITRLTAEKKQKDADAEKKRLEDEAEQKRKDDELRLENEKKQKELDAEKEQMRKDRIELRGEQLIAVGFTHDSINKHYSFGSKKISENDVAEFDKQNWDNWLNEAKKGIAKYRTVKARVAELENIGLVFNDAKKEYQFEGITVSTHFIDEATDGGWEECIVDTKQKIEAVKALTELKQKRHEQLVGLGLHCDIQFQGYSYKKTGFDVSTHLKNDSDSEWDNFIGFFIVKNITNIDLAIILQGQRYNALAPYAAYGTQLDMNNLYQMSDLEWNSVLEEKKAAYDKKVSDDAQAKIDADAKKKADELAAASDSVKWHTVIEYIGNAPVLVMESEEYKAKYKKLEALLEQIGFIK